jgi:hypothetical protein
MYTFRSTARLAPLVLALALAQVAHADDDISYRFSGFGTLGYVQTNTDDLILHNPGQVKGADKSGSFLVDSRVGGQFDVTFNSQWSATVQALAAQDAKGDFTPKLEWAFVRYKATDSLSIRLGRLGWPAYLVSDYRYVGYSNPWVRAPLEVYGLAALDSFDGCDITWTHALGPGTVSVQVLGGHASTDAPDTTQVTAHLDVNQLYGAYLTYDIGDLHLRGGASTAHVTYTSNGTTELLDGLQYAGFDSITSALNANHKRTTFTSFGATYDAHRILLMGEYGSLRSSSFLSRDKGWYGTFGYHFGAWMPYVTYAGENKPSQSNTYAIPPYGPLLPLSAGLSSLVAPTSQHTVSTGVRWDVYKNIDIKVQFDHVRPNINGGDFSVASSNYDGHPVNVYSAVVDVVF